MWISAVDDVVFGRVRQLRSSQLVEGAGSSGGRQQMCVFRREKS